MGNNCGDSGDRSGRKSGPLELGATVSLRQWRASFDAVAQPIWLLDAAMRIVEANRATSELFGVSPRAVRGRQCWEVVHGTDAPIAGCPGVRAASSGQRETTRLQRDGRWLQVTVDPIVDDAGSSVGYVHLVDDVTDRVCMEEELRGSEQRFRWLVERLNDVLYSMTTDGRITYASPRTEEMLGYRPEEVVGLRFPELVHAEDLAKVRANFARILTGELVSSQFRVRAKFGAYRWVRSSSRAVRERDQIVAVNGVLTDIQDSRELEARLAQADRLSSMGLLAAGLAHEINNPLAYVIESLDCLEEELRDLAESGATAREALSGELDPERTRASAEDTALHPKGAQRAKSLLRNVRSGAQRIEETARHLRRFSSAGRDRSTKLDLDHAIDLALSLATNEIRHRARVVRQRGAVRAVRADEGRLSQVFLHLLVNAAHAIDEGSAEENEISVRTWTEVDWVCAEVSDTGSGIERDAQARIFEPFFTMRGLGEASGLGLSIAKSVVEELGGTVEFQSKSGVGSTFTVRLPAAPQTPLAAPLRETKPTGRARTGRILVVDDEPKIRAGMRRILRDHSTVEAASGREARALLEVDGAFDAILCDVMMPDGTGTELYSWLLEARPKLAKKLAFVTGGAFSSRVRAVLDRGEAPVLSKPFEPAALLQLVDQLLAKPAK